ncbi:MAG: DegT/DnrJ/EryC1/StrS family aminotransferase, partial [Alphaproteobacteria bacterium]|nr:DegT/DnrJ/EryC1/StrS family aminotransferase [Alphaproteobacteria bacterium]
DLAAQRQRIAPEIDAAIQRVLAHGQFVMGPEIAELEKILAEFTGAAYCVTCGSGTEALQLPLMAWDIGPGDAVICPSFTFVATAEMVALLRATPIFVDVSPHDANLNPDLIEDAIKLAQTQGLRPKAIIPVDLYGQPANYDAILPIAERYNLRVLADAAQSFGASWKGRKVGDPKNASLKTAPELTVATSFFPSKPLGCYGEGGAIFTNDKDLALRLQQIRFHGQGQERYKHPIIGINGRLETIQAAILLQKMTIFADELVKRRQVAENYNNLIRQANLTNHVTPPVLRDGVISAWAQYTLRVPAALRSNIIDGLKQHGIPTAVHYPFSLSDQPGYAHYPSYPSDMPVARDLAKTVLSLPMHPYVTLSVQEYIISALSRVVRDAQ